MVGTGAVAAQRWSSCEEIPHAQGQRRSPSKMVGGVNLCVESNPITARDAQRAQTNLMGTRTQGPTETETELCLNICWGAIGWQWSAAGTGFWVWV